LSANTVITATSLPSLFHMSSFYVAGRSIA
jgi:hypothetical protein